MTNNESFGSNSLVLDAEEADRIFEGAPYSFIYPSLHLLGSGEEANVVPEDMDIAYSKHRTKEATDPETDDVWRASDLIITKMALAGLTNQRFVCLTKDPYDSPAHFSYRLSDSKVLVSGFPNFGVMNAISQMRIGLRAVELYGANVETVEE